MRLQRSIKLSQNDVGFEMSAVGPARQAKYTCLRARGSEDVFRWMK